MLLTMLAATLLCAGLLWTLHPPKNRPDLAALIVVSAFVGGIGGFKLWFWLTAARKLLEAP